MNVEDMEAALKREREFNAHIFSAAPTLIVAIKPDGTTLTVNPAVTRLTGYSAEELVGSSWWDLFYPGDEFRQVEKLLEDFKKGPVTNYDMVLTLRDGSKRTISWNSVNRLDASGQTQEIIGIGSDITDRKKVEQELREANTFLDSIVENIPDMIFVKDAANLGFVRVNKAVEELLGYSRDELRGKSDHDFFPKSQASFFVAKDREVLSGRQTMEIAEEPIHTKAKGRRVLNTKKMPIVDESGQPLYLLGISRDITEPLAAQEALRRQALVFDNMYDGVVLADPAGCISAWNRGAERIFGYSRDDILGRKLEDLAAPEFSGDVFVQIKQALLTQKRWSGELLLVHKSGKGVTGEAVVVPLTNKQGEAVATIYVIRDVTARKLAEQRVREHKLELERVSRFSALGEMTGDLAHQLNQPLTALRNYVRGCLRRMEGGAPIGEELVEKMTMAVEQADRASAIIRNIRNLAREESRQPVLVDINRLVRDVVSLSQYLSTTDGCKIRLDLEEALPSVYADPIQIEQVLMNLISNGIEATEKAPGNDHEVTVRTVAADDHVIVEVRDTGEGLSNVDLTRLFEPFYTTKSTGLGLGLSISRKFVENHGGRLEMSSNPDRGAAFRFTLPTSTGKAGDVQ